MSNVEKISQRLVQALEDRGNVIILLIFLISTVFAFTKVVGREIVPLLGKEHGNFEQRRKAFLKDGSRLYQEGYEKFKDKICRLTTADGMYLHGRLGLTLITCARYSYNRSQLASR